MNQHTTGVREFSPAQISSPDAIVSTAFTEVRTHYGSGFPNYQPGSRGNLYYHHLGHTLGVWRGTYRMGHALGLSLEERKLAGMAAAAHDVVQQKDRGIMEQESADWLIRAMRYSGIFEERHFTDIELAIPATQPLFRGGTAVSTAIELEYPTKAAERIALSVASADYSELFAPTSSRTGHEVYLEGLGPRVAPSYEGLLNFQRRQVVFMEQFRFPHPMAEGILGGLRSEATNHAIDLVKRLERGHFSSFREVFAADEAFARIAAAA